MYHYFVIVPCQPFRILGPYPQYSQTDWLRGKKSKRYCCRCKDCHDLVYKKLIGKALPQTLIDGTCSRETVTVTGGI
jgi:hypothetical protein